MPLKPRRTSGRPRNKPASSKKIGRPSKFKPSFCELVVELGTRYRNVHHQYGEQRITTNVSLAVLESPNLEAFSDRTAALREFEQFCLRLAAADATPAAPTDNGALQ
jgi:hypothetical protein